MEAKISHFLNSENVAFEDYPTIAAISTEYSGEYLKFLLSHCLFSLHEKHTEKKGRTVLSRIISNAAKLPQKDISWEVIAEKIEELRHQSEIEFIEFDFEGAIRNFLDEFIPTMSKEERHVFIPHQCLPRSEMRYSISNHLYSDTTLGLRIEKDSIEKVVSRIKILAQEYREKEEIEKLYGEEIPSFPSGTLEFLDTLSKPE